MKTIVFSFVFVSIFLLSSCAKMEQPVIGYIPVNEKVHISWIDVPGGPALKETILVVTDKGDTIFATILGGDFGVRYRDSYPPVVGKKVFVKLLMNNDGVYYIDVSSLEPFDK